MTERKKPAIACLSLRNNHVYNYMQIDNSDNSMDKRRDTMKFTKVYNLSSFLIILSFFPLIFSLAGCGSGSNADGRIVDFFQETPIDGAIVVADTKTDIAEEKKSAHIVAKTNSSGKFRIKNMLPERYYELTISAPGYSSTKSRVSSPSKKQTKIIEKPIKLIKLPPQKGMFIFSSGQFVQLSPFTKINRERRILYTGFAVESPSIRYLLEKDLSEQSIPKVKNGSFLIIYGKEYAFWSNNANMYRGGYVFPWYIHSLKKFPQRTYKNGRGKFVKIPESYYCGLLSVNEERGWGGHKYKDFVTDVRDTAGTRGQSIVVYKLSLPKGKYLISNFHNKAYVSSTDYSEKRVIGFLFEII